MKKQSFLGLVLLAVIVCQSAMAQEDPTDIVATAIREQGFACDDPQTATPDPENSSPDEKAWIIRCGDSRYRVTFRGDTGAKVERLDE